MTIESHLVAMPLASVPGGAIFDCDGTLADTMPIHYRAWCDILEPLSCPFPSEQFYTWGGVTAHEIVERLNAEHGLTMPLDDTVHRKETHFGSLALAVVSIEPVVAEARRLHALGCPLAVASGGLRYVVEQTLQTLGIRDLFSAIATADDVVRGKPAPDVFLVAAERLGVPAADCVVFEDAPAGIEAARRAGMHAVNILDFLPPSLETRAAP